MKTLPVARARSAFLLVAVLAAAGTGGLADLGTGAWRLGGGVALLSALALGALIALPLWLLEVSLGRLTGRPLPGALAALAGPLGEGVAWLGLCNAGLAAVALGARAAGGLGLASTAWVQAPSGPGLLSLLAGSVAWAVAGWAASGPGRLARLARLVAPLFAALLALAAARALLGAGSPAPLLPLLIPRTGALAAPATWTGALSSGLLMAGAGLGLGAALAAELLPPRGSAAWAGTLSALVGASLQALLALLGYGLLVTTAPAVAAERVQGLALPAGADALGLDGACGWLGFTVLAAALTRAGTLSLADRFDVNEREAARRVALLGALGTVALLALGPPDAQDAGLSGLIAAMLLHDTLGVGLPAAALLLALLAARALDLPGLLRRMDLEAGPRLAPWLPLAVGRLAPALLALGLGLRLAAPDPRGALLREAAGQAALPGGLSGVLHVVVPVCALLLVCVPASALTWLAPPAQPSALARRSR